MKQLVMCVLMLAFMACGATPKTESDRADLRRRAETTLQSMKAKDSTLQRLLDSGAGYVVFPEIGKGGLIAGGAYGRGVLYEHGQPTAFVELSQASLGAQIGAQTFSELVVFRQAFDVEKIKRGDYSLGANMSAVALTSGVAGTVDTSAAVAVFVVPRGGAMAELSVSGQRIKASPEG
jgi:lipid-binding SYLF domain-containing protein